MRRKLVWLLAIACVTVAVAVPASISLLRSRPRAPLPLTERDTWDVCRVRGVRAGYFHTTITQDTEDGSPVVKVEQVLHLDLKRLGQPIVQEIRLTDTETPEGKLISSECEMRDVRLGRSFQRTTARVRGDRLEVEVATMGKRKTESLDWSAKNGGMLGDATSLLRRPMKPGEHRVLTHFGADNQMIETDLTAQQEEHTDLLGGRFRLLRIDQVDRLPKGQSIRGTIWTDPSGEVVKLWNDLMKMEAFRTPKEVALAETPLAKLDLGEDTLVRLNRPLPQGHDTRQARYLVRLKEG
ncbi:MAG: hypothetical protein ABR915_21735, partial [Thermoguttaceae bacterium]